MEKTSIAFSKTNAPLMLDWSKSLIGFGKVTILALQAADRKVAKQSLMEAQEQNEDGEQHQDCRRHSSRRVRHFVLRRRRNDVQAICDCRIGRHVNKRRVVIVPIGNEMQQEYREERILYKGNNNSDKNIQIPCAVDFRSFRISHRQRFEVAIEYQEIHTEEVCSHYPQTPELVVQSEEFCHSDFRRQCTNDRKDHGYHNDRVNNLREEEVESCAHIRRQHRYERVTERAAYRIDERIQEHLIQTKRDHLTFDNRSYKEVIKYFDEVSPLPTPYHLSVGRGGSGKTENVRSKVGIVLYSRNQRPAKQVEHREYVQRQDYQHEDGKRRESISAFYFSSLLFLFRLRIDRLFV